MAGGPLSVEMHEPEIKHRVIRGALGTCSRQEGRVLVRQVSRRV